MIGAILGDIAGSRFEFSHFKSKSFDLLAQDCRFTDDTVLTLAVCKVLLNYQEGDTEQLKAGVVDCLREEALSHPTCGYGGRFWRWVKSSSSEPYDSFGNGAAMRVSGCGYVAKTLEEVKVLSKAVTVVTHNHPEAIKAAEATSVCIFLARMGKSLEDIKQYVQDNYYALDFTLDEIRPDYRHEVSCQKSVPQALECFFESENFEDSIRNAISLGGDSDTIAAIAGSIAEPFYGVPQKLRDRAVEYLDDELRQILFDFEERFPPKVLQS